MRKRCTAITIRVTETEKNMLLRNATLCKLNLSDYIRNVALGKKIAISSIEELSAM